MEGGSERGGNPTMEYSYTSCKSMFLTSGVGKLPLTMLTCFCCSGV